MFIWQDEYEDMIEIISNLKEFDSSFMCNKVNILSINNNDYQILERTKHQNKYEILDNFMINLKKVLTWEQKFDLLLKFIDENKTIPSTFSNNP
jgi:hypothetical protein